MKQLIDIINEKLRITSKSNYQISNIDFDNDKMIISIIKSIFISVYKKRTYRIRGICTYIINRSEINWKDVIEILNTEYNIDWDEEDAIKKNGKFQTFVRPLLTKIEHLINMRKENFLVKDKESGKSVEFELLGKDIYWGDWKNYRKKYNLTGY